eukprot:514474-Rhodomonas_salina.2
MADGSAFTTNAVFVNYLPAGLHRSTSSSGLFVRICGPSSEWFVCICGPSRIATCCARNICPNPIPCHL